MAIQVNHPLYSNTSSSSSLLVSKSINNHCLTIVYFFYSPSFISFLGCILGTSKDNLTWLGQFISLFAEVSGKPYGTAIDLRIFILILSFIRWFILCLYNHALYLLYKQYQYLCWYQWLRSRSSKLPISSFLYSQSL